MSASITILVVDDHQSVRRGLRAYLDAQSDFHVVGEAGSGEEAVEIVPALIPDIVLLDLIMPGMNGIETTREIKRLSPCTQVVMLTSSGDEHRSAALEAGAVSYLLKNLKMEHLMDALRGIQVCKKK